MKMEIKVGIAVKKSMTDQTLLPRYRGIIGLKANAMYQMTIPILFYFNIITKGRICLAVGRGNVIRWQLIREEKIKKKQT